MSKKLVYKNKDIGGVMTVDFPVGCIVPFASNENLPSGFLLCDGSPVSREMFPDLFAVIGTTWGEGDGETTFNLPLIEDRVLQGASGTNPVGTYLSAGLPNIEGQYTISDNTSSAHGGMTSSGPFERKNSIVSAATNTVAWTGAGGPCYDVGFNASKSNSIYGNSDTVQPPAACVKFIIKAFDSQTRDSALIDITQYAQALNGKMTHDEPYTDNFCIIYPNGGTEAEPATITVNNRYVMDNPFPGYRVFCEAEVFYSNTWGKSGYYGSNAYGFVDVSQYDDDEIVLQTGMSYLVASSPNSGNPFGVATGLALTSAPCRIKVWKIGKIPTQS